MNYLLYNCRVNSKLIEQDETYQRRGTINGVDLG